MRIDDWLLVLNFDGEQKQKAVDTHASVWVCLGIMQVRASMGGTTTSQRRVEKTANDTQCA